MKLKERILTFWQESNGASLVEFVLILPLLTLISLGIFEVTNYVLLSQRLNEISSGVANWVSSKTTTAEITDCLIGANLVGAEYSFQSKGGVVVSGVQQSGTPATQQVVWQMSSVGAMSQMSTNGCGMINSAPFTLASEPQLIVVEVTYAYKPVFSYFSTIFPSVTLLRVNQVIPRSGRIFNPLPAA